MDNENGTNIFLLDNMYKNMATEDRLWTRIRLTESTFLTGLIYRIDTNKFVNLQAVTNEEKNEKY